MDEQFIRITLYNRDTLSYYSEQEIAEYCRLEVQVVRQLRDAGVIKGIDVVGDELRYGNDDLALLRRVRRLYYDLDINLEGVEVILRLYSRVQKLQHELERYQKLDENDLEGRES